MLSSVSAMARRTLVRPAPASTALFSRAVSRRCRVFVRSRSGAVSSLRYNSSAPPQEAGAAVDDSPSSNGQQEYSLGDDGDVVSTPVNNYPPPLHSSHAEERNSEYIEFPAHSSSPDNDNETQPLLLNAKEHVVGYLSRILNARVYDVAVETELQHAKNLSSVGVRPSRTALCSSRMISGEAYAH